MFDIWRHRSSAAVRNNSVDGRMRPRVRLHFRFIILVVVLGCLFIGLQLQIPGLSFLDLYSNLTNAWRTALYGPPLPCEMQRVRELLALWEASPMLKYPRDTSDPFLQQAERNLRNVSIAPPHLENCQARVAEYHKLDSRSSDGRRPAWSLWKGEMGLLDGGSRMEVEESEEFLGDKAGLVWGPFPPWIEGADEDNLPMTRRAQRDIWLMQHPPDCDHPSVRFFALNWSSYEHFGLGAQIFLMSGFFAMAMRERRVLVMQDFNRADHGGCQGLQFRSWSCYFLPETSVQCRIRAEQLMKDPRAVAAGRVLLEENISTQYDVWTAAPPDLWGQPWDHMQPTLEIEGQLYTHLHHLRDIRWWRSQAVRYLTRFPSEYMCMLMNKARHDAFGERAATLVLRAAAQALDGRQVEEGQIEKWVWRNHKVWVPRPLLNIHVRMGDKSSEMKLVDLQGYMALARRLRNKFPYVEDIWLSTEMQEVVDASHNYSGWNFYYTNVSRQVGDTRMASYLKSLGVETASANSFVNLLMAADSDFFVGALGSSWCYLIDALRATGGKQMAGYMSVNVDRFWKRKHLL